METAQNTEMESIAWELMYHIHASLQILETGYGFYKLIKYNDSRLLNGLQLLFKGLYFSVWMIYGIMGKNYTYTLPIYVGIALFQLLLYLILIKQWDYIVYQFTVIINTSWYMRQTTLDDLVLGCNIVSFLLMIIPAYHLYKAISTKDYRYLSRYVYFIGIIESTVYLLYTYHRAQYIISCAAMIKILIMIVMDTIHRNQLLKLKEQQEKKTN
ncbi:hypothetical protein ABPG74_018041 [Tetrahymena malaccensis]